jgi:hypothetical protein
MGFWKDIITSENTTSSKRLVTLVIAMHFILASFVILFIAFYVIFYTTRGKVDKDLLDLLKDVLEKDFFIILSGLGFITSENLFNILLQKEKAKASNMMGSWYESGMNQMPYPSVGGIPIDEGGNSQNPNDT